MANAEFQRTPIKNKFVYVGVDFHHPPDLMPPGRAPFLLNVDPTVIEGALQPRPGMRLLNNVNANGAVHSIKRVNDSVPGAFNPYAIFVGIVGNLYVGQVPFPPIDAGYSGNPLSMVPYRPPQSPETWLYVFDSQRKQKYLTDGFTKQNIGIAVPNQPPSTVLGVPMYTMLQDAVASGSWSASGDAGSPSTTNRVPGGVTTLATVYDVPNGTNSVGWCSVALQGSSTGYQWLTQGMRIRVDDSATNQENVTVEQVYTSLPSTTVKAVAFDAGNTGPCTVTLQVSTQGLVRNQLIKIGTNYMVVISVTAGPDDTYSFRTNAPAPFMGGDTVLFPPGFRCYFTQLPAHTSGEGVKGVANSSAITFSTGVGTVSLSGLTVDLLALYPISFTTEDYMTIGFWCDTPSAITEVHFLLDVDAQTNNFQNNYYYYIARQGDFTSVLTGNSPTIPSLLNVISTDIADTYEASSQTTAIGALPYPAAGPANFASGPDVNSQLPSSTNAWFQCMFKLGNLVRVGNDPSVNLGNVKAIGIQVYVTASCNIAWGSWWVGGGYGPDVNFNSFGNQAPPIQYRYRYRATKTGAVSDVSPPTRNGDLPRRQNVALTLTPSPDPQVDVIDIERFGGTLDGWKLVLTVPNSGSAVDTVTEARAAGSEPLDLKQYVPFPVTDQPHYGTCNVVGTRVTWLSGDLFNTSWIRGVEIIIQGQTYTLYAPPTSNIILHTEENIGVLSNVAFTIPEATIAGANLPYAWESKGNDVIMACGDVYNPGFLYFTNRGNPDSASDAGYIEITSPSEPLIGGGHYEGADYVFTTEGIYRVEPTQGGVNPFASYKLSLTYGLAGPWAFTVDAPYIFYVATDGGIYAYNPAGQSERLTNDLYPLFPHEGEPGQPINFPMILPDTNATLYPPNFALSQFMRLEFLNNQLFFDYVDTTSTWHSLVYDMAQKGWIPLYYNPQVTVRYQEEGTQNPRTFLGTANGSIYQVSNKTGDDTTGIACVVVTPADDQGDSRMLKQYGDVVIDFQGTVSVQPYYKQFEVSPVNAAYNAGPQLPRGQYIVPIVSSGDGKDTSLQRNIGLVIQWTTTPD